MLWVLIRIAAEAILIEVILMSTHNIGFYEPISKIIFKLSSNMHIISSSNPYLLYVAFADSVFRFTIGMV